MKSKLSEFITSHSENIVVVVQGLGFVGSVMSLVCANAIKGDYAVIGVDLPNEHGKKIINDLNNGIFPLIAEDPKIDEFFNNTFEKENFFATTETDAYKVADVIIVDINLDVEKDNHNSGKLINYNVLILVGF
tara:strand:+ start:30 stop:428 length:399 start_codon:yes stop_codon:yes gene_type:complete